MEIRFLIVEGPSNSLLQQGFKSLGTHHRHSVYRSGKLPNEIFLRTPGDFTLQKVSRLAVPPIELETHPQISCFPHMF